METNSKAAILFADVSGSTRLYETVGDVVAAAAIDECLSVLKEKTLECGGRVIKTIGDEVMSLFPSASDAANAAIKMQGGVDLLPPAAGHKIMIRIGFNFGPVLERDGDVFGDAVNVAARLAGQAQKEQIITSRETADLLSPQLQSVCRRLYSIQVKGKEQEVQLCQIMWRAADEFATMMGDSAAPFVMEAVLRIKHEGVEQILDASREVINLGRDKASQVVINDPKASRNHCKIERRMDKFVLADHSTNGTFVTVEGDRELLLRREEFTLRGHGWIAFGHARKETDEIVEFFCE